MYRPRIWKKYTWQNRRSDSGSRFFQEATWTFQTWFAAERMAKWVKSEHPENLSSHHPAFQSRDQSMQRELTENAPDDHERTNNTADGRQGADGVMQHPGIAPEPGLGSCQPGPKPSLLGSKRSHSSGNRSDDSESGTEQSHHDQRQRRRGGVRPDRNNPCRRPGPAPVYTLLTRSYVHAGNPWSEDEHRNFLAGLKKLGKVSQPRYHQL